MKLQITTPKDVQTNRSVSPQVRFHKSGLISFNKGSVDLMDLGDRGGVIFLWDDDEKHYYVAKALEKEKAFNYRPGYAGKNSNSRIFNSSGFVRLIRERLEMPIGKKIPELGKEKVSVSLDIDETPVEYEGRMIYKLY